MKRPRFQFRLRTLFWLTLFAAMCCAFAPPLWKWAEPRLYPNPPVRYLGEVIDYRTAKRIAIDSQFRSQYLAERRRRLNGPTAPRPTNPAPVDSEPSGR